MKFGDFAADVFFRCIAKEFQLGPVCPKDCSIGPDPMQRNSDILDEVPEIRVAFGEIVLVLRGG